MRKTIFLSLLVALVLSFPAFGYKIDSEGNYILSKAEMQAIVKDSKIKDEKIKKLEKDVVVLKDTSAKDKLIKEYKTLAENKTMECEALKALNDNLNAQVALNERKSEIYEAKYKRSKTRNVVAWGIAAVMTGVAIAK